MATTLRVPRPLRRVLAVLIVAAIVEFFVLPQMATALGSARTLAEVSGWLLLLGVGLEVAALCAYFQLTRSLLPAATRPAFPRMARIELSTLGLSHVVPGGAGAGGALGYRLLTEAGVRPADATFALATQGLGSAVVLNVILWLALVVSIPARGVQPLYTTAAVLGAVVFGLFALALVGLTRAEARTTETLCRVARRMPLVDCGKVERGVQRVAARLRELAAQPRLVARAVGWATANWLLDAASLWVFLAAFGHRTGIDSLLVAYGLANVLGALPVTPGGLGIIEGVLTPTLVGFGVPGGTALLGVVSWRLVNFWLPIPAGGAAYLSLRLGPGEGRGRRAEELKRVVEDAADPSD
ncbi:MAG: YbhN family protein [Acidimicrobiia bacterium]